MSDIPIESDRAMPAPRNSKYPFRSMKIGDSFFVADNSGRVRSTACVFAARNPDYKFSTRQENGGYRVWRVSADGEHGT